MPHLKTRDDQSLHVKDTGEGRPIILIHGWPLTGDMWEYQTLALLEAGYRVITYDRRGFGASSHPVTGYDYDTFADDLAEVLEATDIRDATLVGFSMGGGEIARYLSRHGAERVRSVALVASVVPYLLKDDSNPGGVDYSALQGMKDGVRKDRFDFLQSFAKAFYGVGLVSHPVSQGLLDWSFILAIMASPQGDDRLYRCVRHHRFPPRSRGLHHAHADHPRHRGQDRADRRRRPRCRQGHPACRLPRI